jgi:hypothetical protein
VDVSEQSNGAMAFRLFAFLPHAKGTLISRMYALELPLDSLMEDNDAGNEGGISLPIYEMDYTGWADSSWGADTTEHTRPTLLAPLFLVDHFGESPLAFSRGPSFSGESSLKVTSSINNSMIEFHLDGENLSGGVAAAFHYGLDPLADDSDGSNLSVEAFYDTDGVSDSGKALHHGLVRAQEVSGDPYAMISSFSLPLAGWKDSSTALVAGALWIDAQMIAQYSIERKTLLSEFEINLPTQSPSSTTAGNMDDHTSSLCPPDSIRNLALLSEGARILAVSSNFGTTPSAVSSSFGAEKAIDGLGNTAWSSAGDGNDASISIQLPFPSNLAFVEIHTRTMGTSAQIFEFQVEVSDDVNAVGGDGSGNVIAAPSCSVLDASRPYKCNLEHEVDSGGAKNVTVVTFHVVRSSGGNTGAVEIGAYGCSVDEEPLQTIDETTAAPITDDEQNSSEQSAGVLLTVSHSLLIPLFVTCIHSLTFCI